MNIIYSQRLRLFGPRINPRGSLARLANTHTLVQEAGVQPGAL